MIVHNESILTKNFKSDTIPVTGEYPVEIRTVQGYKDAAVKSGLGILRKILHKAWPARRASCGTIFLYVGWSIKPERKEYEWRPVSTGRYTLVHPIIKNLPL